MTSALRGAIAALLIAAGAQAGDDVSDVVGKVLSKHDVPALGGAIVSRSGVDATGVAGVRRAGGAAKVTVDDRWHLGSCTKAMTATLIARYVERGRFAWDRKLEAPAWKDVTVDLLLRHRGGAPEDLRFDGLWARLWKREGTVVEQREMLMRAVLAREPGKRGAFAYSNAGYAIAGHLLEVQEKKSWEDLMRAELFAPLGMKSAGFGAPGEDQPCGHVVRGGRLVAVPPGPAADNPPAIGPAGTVHASLADWGRFVALHLPGPEADPAAKDGEAAKGDPEPPYLSPATLAYLRTPRDGEDYALGWIVTTRGWAGGTVLTHAGSNTMWYAVAWIAPKRGFAVIATCNRGGEEGAAACDDVASALLERVRKPAR